MTKLQDQLKSDSDRLKPCFQIVLPLKVKIGILFFIAVMSICHKNLNGINIEKY